MRIYLIGFMGCGKTSLGKRLARKLRFDFFDTDKGLEEASGTPVPELFRSRGEAAFRLLEQKVLHSTAALQQTVIATGGGLPCFDDNMDFILQHGTAVYLRMSVSSLASRLENARVKRPLVEDYQGDDLPPVIADLLNRREPFYLRAHCIIKGETVKASHIISLLFGGEGKKCGEEPGLKQED